MWRSISRWRKVGQAMPGYYADLLVLVKNRLEDVLNSKKLSLVILDGKTLDRQKLLAR